MTDILFLKPGAGSRTRRRIAATRRRVRLTAPGVLRKIDVFCLALAEFCFTVSFDRKKNTKQIQGILRACFWLQVRYVVLVYSSTNLVTKQYEIVQIQPYFEPVMLLRDFCDFKSDLRDFAFQPLRSALHGHILQKKPHFCGIYPSKSLKTLYTAF